MLNKYYRMDIQEATCNTDQLNLRTNSFIATTLHKDKEPLVSLPLLMQRHGSEEWMSIINPWSTNNNGGKTNVYGTVISEAWTLPAYLQWNVGFSMHSFASLSGQFQILPLKSIFFRTFQIDSKILLFFFDDSFRNSANLLHSVQVCTESSCTVTLTFYHSFGM